MTIWRDLPIGVGVRRVPEDDDNDRQAPMPDRELDAYRRAGFWACRDDHGHLSICLQELPGHLPPYRPGHAAQDFRCGVEQQAARQPLKLEVPGSIPGSATQSARPVRPSPMVGETTGRPVPPREIPRLGDERTGTVEPNVGWTRRLGLHWRSTIAHRLGLFESGYNPHRLHFSQRAADRRVRRWITDD